jgi:hypothetical protein
MKHLSITCSSPAPTSAQAFAQVPDQIPAPVSDQALLFICSSPAPTSSQAFLTFLNRFLLQCLIKHCSTSPAPTSAQALFHYLLKNLLQHLLKLLL